MPYVMLKMLVCFAVMVSSAHVLSSNSSTSQDNLKQRKLYEQAQKAFSDKKLQRYQALKAQLTDYALYPYLEYTELNQYVTYRQTRSKQMDQRVDQFLRTHNDTYLGNALLNKWLRSLASAQKWQDYKRYYQPHVKKTELKCLYLQARIRTGDIAHSPQYAQQVAQQTQALWLHPKSQPKACDLAFATWEKQGHLTQQMLWQRHRLAVNKKRYSLATYLRKKMDSDTRLLAQFYEEFHKTPSKIKNAKQFSNLQRTQKKSDTYVQKVTDIIYNGLYRYAYQHPLESLSLFNELKSSYAFDEESQYNLQTRIATRLIKKNELNTAASLIKKIPEQYQQKPLERLLRVYLREQQWAKIYAWMQELPQMMKQEDRWQYWTARSLEELEHTAAGIDADDTIDDIYRSLSKSRSFYGFLAADKRQSDYWFEDRPSPINLDTLKKVRELPDFKRAKELFLLGKMYRARTEWAYGVKKLSTQEHIAAGQLAHSWGWNRKAIEAMAGAKYWDDLSIRFPVVHADIIHKKAKDNNVPSALIFSIARQESAWEFDAKSRVGARGLMQIMPATAKQTAKKANVRYSKKKLIDPEYNITLGSHYISSLLKQYNNHRPLAIASYNAGPHRVKQWLAKTQQKLPLDVWIEIIPFQETRKYVQNVLSYKVIYNHRQGHASKLLTSVEQNLPL